MNENFWSNLSTLTLIINKNFEESFALIRTYVMTRTKTEPSLVDGEFKLMFHTNRDLKEDFESLVRKYHSQIAQLTVDNIKVSEREMAAFNKACDIQQEKLKAQKEQLIFLGASEKTLQIFDKDVNDWLIFQSEFSDYIKKLKFSSIRIQGEQITKDGWFVFNQTLDYKLTESNKDGLHAIFSDSTFEYEVHIKEDSVDRRFLTVSIIAGANGLEKNDDLTGLGKPIPVLSTTINILLEHLNIHGTRPVRLLAVDEPRCKLYYNISRKIFSDWYVCVAGNNVIVLPLSYFENKREINEENHCTSA